MNDDPSYSSSQYAESLLKQIQKNFLLPEAIKMLESAAAAASPPVPSVSTLKQVAQYMDFAASKRFPQLQTRIADLEAQVKKSQDAWMALGTENRRTEGRLEKRIELLESLLSEAGIDFSPMELLPPEDSEITVGATFS